LQLTDALFQVTLEHSSVKVCEFLWHIYNGNCNPRWPTRFSPDAENAAKWTWLQTIIPFASGSAKEAFAYAAYKFKCISSYKWIIAQLPEARLSRVLSDVRGSVDFLIALYEYYPNIKCWPDGVHWHTHRQIEFLALHGDKIKLGDDFLPVWPNDFAFFKENQGKFQWGPQKGKKIRKYLANSWSEENFQHWLTAC
jgi:hypothetical protein